jgi:hypothetical protein
MLLPCCPRQRGSLLLVISKTRLTALLCVPKDARCSKLKVQRRRIPQTFLLQVSKLTLLFHTKIYLIKFQKSDLDKQKSANHIARTATGLLSRLKSNSRHLF